VHNARDQPDWDPDRLISVIVAANRLCHVVLEDKAVGYIESLLSDEILMQKQPRETWVRILDVGIELNLTRRSLPIPKRMTYRLTHELRTNPDLDPMLVWPVTEKHGLSTLRADVYYRILMNALKSPRYVRDSSPKHKLASRITLPADLPESAHGPIFTGYLSLSLLWERLRTKAPEFKASRKCPERAHARCQRVWQKRWLAAVASPEVMGLSPADVMGALKKIAPLVEYDEEVIEGMGKLCKEEAIGELSQLIIRIEDELPDHFD
jgi:hypothetical protein